MPKVNANVRKVNRKPAMPSGSHTPCYARVHDGEPNAYKGTIMRMGERENR